MANSLLALRRDYPALANGRARPARRPDDKVVRLRGLCRAAITSSSPRRTAVAYVVPDRAGKQDRPLQGHPYPGPQRFHGHGGRTSTPSIVTRPPVTS